MQLRHVETYVAGAQQTRLWRFALAALLFPVFVNQPATAALFSDDEARKATADLRAEVLQMRSASDSRFTRLETSVDSLQKTVDLLQRSFDTLQKSIEALQKSLDAAQKTTADLVAKSSESLQKSIDRVEQSDKLGLATFQSRLDGFSTDVAKLRGDIEVEDNSLQQAEKRNKALYLDLDGRLKVLEQSAADVSAKLTQLKEDLATRPADPPPAETKAEPEKPAEVVKAPEPKVAVPTPAEQKAYDQAQAAFKSQNYVASVKAFQGVIKSFAGGALESQARFWLGVSHYRLKAYTAAENEFKDLIKKFPDSPKAPDAYFNLASAQLDAGNAPGAHDTLDELITRYPASEAAGKARARLGRK